MVMEGVGKLTCDVETHGKRTTRVPPLSARACASILWPHSRPAHAGRLHATAAVAAGGGGEGEVAHNRDQAERLEQVAREEVQ